MEFYTLYDSKKEKELAEIVEFDDGQVVVKWNGRISGLIIHKNLQEFEEVSLVGNRVLIKQGVKEIEEESSPDDEQIQKARDILYSA